MFGLRVVCASAIGELVFTFIVIICNYAGVFSPEHLVDLFLSSYGFKIMMNFIFAIPVTIVAEIVKTKADIDVYDRNISFNPFNLRTAQEKT